MKKLRSSKIVRKTKETSIQLSINLDKYSTGKIATTIPFIDHMLTLMSYHGGLGLNIKAKGDTHIDDHHLVEDIGITLGSALFKALGTKKGISRYGNFMVPMDEALSYVAIDISGRPFLSFDVKFKSQKGGFDYDLIEDFLYAFAINSKITLHVARKKGRSNHHIAESIFKGLGIALKQAVSRKSGSKTVPSTKGKI